MKIIAKYNIPYNFHGKTVIFFGDNPEKTAKYEKYNS